MRKYCNMAANWWLLAPELLPFSALFGSSLLHPSSFQSSSTGVQQRAARRSALYRRRRSRRIALFVTGLVVAIVASQYISQPREVYTRER